MAGVMTNLEGGKELDAKLLKIERKTAKKIVKTAVRASTKPPLQAVRGNARGMIGGTIGSLIAKNTKALVFKFQRRGSWGMQVGIKPDVPEFVETSAEGRKNYIPAAIEYGHDEAAAIPFIRNAWDATREKARKIIGVELKKGIEAAGK